MNRKVGELHPLRLTSLSAACVTTWYRAGLSQRSALVEAATAALVPPAGWVMEGEIQDGEEEMFPVLCRFLPPHGRFHVALCCPGNKEGAWLLVFIGDEGEEVLILRQCTTFIPHLLNHSLALTAMLDARGCLVDEISGILTLEGET